MREMVLFDCLGKVHLTDFYGYHEYLISLYHVHVISKEKIEPDELPDLSAFSASTHIQEQLPDIHCKKGRTPVQEQPCQQARFIETLMND